MILTNSVSADYESTIDEMIDYIDSLDNTLALRAWSWFEMNLADSGIYAANAVPSDYLNIMSDIQIKTLYYILVSEKHV